MWCKWRKKGLYFLTEQKGEGVETKALKNILMSYHQLVEKQNLFWEINFDLSTKFILNDTKDEDCFKLILTSSLTERIDFQRRYGYKKNTNL